jgi:hypothetical protein
MMTSVAPEGTADQVVPTSTTLSPNKTGSPGALVDGPVPEQTSGGPETASDSEAGQTLPVVERGPDGLMLLHWPSDDAPHIRKSKSVAMVSSFTPRTATSRGVGPTSSPRRRV